MFLQQPPNSRRLCGWFCLVTKHSRKRQFLAQDQTCFALILQKQEYKLDIFIETMLTTSKQTSMVFWCKGTIIQRCKWMRRMCGRKERVWTWECVNVSFTPFNAFISRCWRTHARTRAGLHSRKHARTRARGFARDASICMRWRSRKREELPINFIQIVPGLAGTEKLKKVRDRRTDGPKGKKARITFQNSNLFLFLCLF